MSIRLVLIAIAVAASAASASAQPAKDDPQAKPSEPVVTMPVVLASASDVRQSVQAPAQPVRRPAPRVTKCRCGDPQLSQGESPGPQPEK